MSTVKTKLDEEIQPELQHVSAAFLTVSETVELNLAKS